MSKQAKQQDEGQIENSPDNEPKAFGQPQSAETTFSVPTWVAIIGSAVLSAIIAGLITIVSYSYQIGHEFGTITTSIEGLKTTAKDNNKNVRDSISSLKTDIVKIELDIQGTRKEISD